LFPLGPATPATRSPERAWNERLRKHVSTLARASGGDDDPVALLPVAQGGDLDAGGSGGGAHPVPAHDLHPKTSSEPFQEGARGVASGAGEGREAWVLRRLRASAR
jgi:hypothetical protein